MGRERLATPNVTGYIATIPVMTLIVGAIDGDAVTITGDTKVTYDEDPIKTASLFDEALPKVILLRDNLAVGVAGAGPARMIEDLLEHRDDDIIEVLGHLRSERDGAFVVGALGPAQLWEVRDGKVIEVPSGQRAWAGDETAFRDFEKLADAWTPGTDEYFRLKSSMDQFVGPLGRSKSVGGFGITAISESGVFRYAPAPFTIFGTDDVLDVYSGRVIPGDVPTPGAVGIYVERAGAGRLFTQDRTATGVKIVAPDRAAFIREAFEQHGQALSG